jgi:AcrR family transcriptional regulator
LKAGYRQPEMVQTPWGNSDGLRERKLNPGVGTPREKVERSQRERLFAATIATVAAKGYEAATVADLLELSGVSRATFYRQFDDKRACFVATLEALLDAMAALVAHRYTAEGTWEERARAVLGTIVELTVAQPAAARVCMVEAYAAGPVALEPLGRAVDNFEAAIAAALEEQPQHRGTPRELTRAVIGGLHWVIYRHLNERREAVLVDCVPALWEWAMSYKPPPRPLRPRGKRTTASGEASAAPSPPFAANIPTERILRDFAAAVTERGYAETKIADIAARAQISQATFYAHFKSKEDALFAAIDSSGSQMMAATLPAVRRAESWPEAVHTALASIFGFLAAEPTFARLQAVEAYAAGPRAIQQRDRSIAEVVEVTLALALGRRPPGSVSIAQEAIVGAIGGILFDRIRHEGPHVLPQYVPLATYMALAPSIGVEQACEIARG